MSKNQVIEWAPFKLAEGVDEAALLTASEALQTGFISKQKGFIKRELVKTTDGQWVDVIHWDSPENAEKAMQNAAENPVCFKYFELMVGPDHNDPSMGVMHLRVMKSYS